MEQEFDINTLLILLAHMRFTGKIIKLNHKTGFVSVDNYMNLTAWLHPEATVSQYEWERLRVGDRIRFGLTESKNYPGTLVAQSICREPHL